MKGYHQLTSWQKKVFNDAHLNHLEYLQTDEERREHAVQSINCLEWAEQEDCIYVYFKNGTSYCYWADGIWENQE